LLLSFSIRGLVLFGDDDYKTCQEYCDDDYKTCQEYCDDDYNTCQEYCDDDQWMPNLLIRLFL
jgi:hypothetical protein